LVRGSVTVAIVLFAVCLFLRVLRYSATLGAVGCCSVSPRLASLRLVSLLCRFVAPRSNCFCPSPCVSDHSTFPNGSFVRLSAFTPSPLPSTFSSPLHTLRSAPPPPPISSSIQSSLHVSFDVCATVFAPGEARYGNAASIDRLLVMGLSQSRIVSGDACATSCIERTLIYTVSVIQCPCGPMPMGHCLLLLSFAFALFRSLLLVQACGWH
jgi:hypothetical protein